MATQQLLQDEHNNNPVYPAQYPPKTCASNDHYSLFTRYLTLIDSYRTLWSDGGCDDEEVVP